MLQLNQIKKEGVILVLGEWCGGIGIITIWLTSANVCRLCVARLPAHNDPVPQFKYHNLT